MPMPKNEDIIEPDIFSDRLPMAGTYFTAEERIASGLFRDPRACDRWTYEHYRNGNYAIPPWERREVLGSGALPGAEEEIAQRLRARIESLGLSRDLRKGAFGCVSRSGEGYYYSLYGFDDLQAARDAAAALSGSWVIATMHDWVVMY